MVENKSTTKKRRTKAEIQSEKKEVAAKAAEKILGTLEQGAMTLVGDEGRIATIEHALIDDSLAEILSRANTRKVDRYAGMIAAVSLAAGTLLYASRISQAYQARRPSPPKPSARPSASEPFPQPGASSVDHLDALLAAPIPPGSAL